MAWPDNFGKNELQFLESLCVLQRVDDTITRGAHRGQASL
jgi:hypothetical protein